MVASSLGARRPAASAAGRRLQLVADRSSAPLITLATRGRSINIRPATAAAAATCCLQASCRPLQLSRAPVNRPLAAHLHTQQVPLPSKAGAAHERAQFASRATICSLCHCFAHEAGRPATCCATPERHEIHQWWPQWNISAQADHLPGRPVARGGLFVGAAAAANRKVTPPPVGSSSPRPDSIRSVAHDYCIANRWTQLEGLPSERYHSHRWPPTGARDQRDCQIEFGARVGWPAGDLLARTMRPPIGRPIDRAIHQVAGQQTQNIPRISLCLICVISLRVGHKPATCCSPPEPLELCSPTRLLLIAAGPRLRGKAPPPRAGPRWDPLLAGRKQSQLLFGSKLSQSPRRARCKGAEANW